MTNLLVIENLSLTFEGAPRPTLRHVSLSLGREKMALVGESGSGKTMLARSILGLLPASAHVSADSFTFEGQDLLTLSAHEQQCLRGRVMTFVLQDPKHALTPTMTIGAQIDEMYTFHKGLSPMDAQQATLESLNRVRIRDPKGLYNKYPHEASGGMGQRAMIAMMLATRPRLLIADEPTSALDADNKKAFLDLIDELVDEYQMSLLFISHDLSTVEGFCDRVALLYMGEILETLNAQDLSKSEHPYTQALLRCVPQRGKPAEAPAHLGPEAL